MSHTTTDRRRLTRLRKKYPALTSDNFSESAFHDLLDDAKRVLSSEVAESLGVGAVLSMDGTAYDEALDSYLALRLGLAIEAASGDGNVDPESALRAGAVPRSPSEMRRLSGLDSGLDYERKRLITALNGLTDDGN